MYIVLATSLISLLHTVLDGGPRKWTYDYEDPSKLMTYQQCIQVLFNATTTTKYAILDLILLNADTYVSTVELDHVVSTKLYPSAHEFTRNTGFKSKELIYIIYIYIIYIYYIL